MKIMSSIELVNRNAYFNELRLLQKLDSEYIVKYFDNFSIGLLNFCIVMEYFEVG